MKDCMPFSETANDRVRGIRLRHDECGHLRKPGLGQRVRRSQRGPQDSSAVRDGLAYEVNVSSFPSELLERLQVGEFISLPPKVALEAHEFWLSGDLSGMPGTVPFRLFVFGSLEEDRSESGDLAEVVIGKMCFRDEAFELKGSTELLQPPDQ